MGVLFLRLHIVRLSSDVQEQGEGWRPTPTTPFSCQMISWERALTECWDILHMNWRHARLMATEREMGSLYSDTAI